MTVALTLLVPLLFAATPARKGITPLVDLVDASTVVCIGRVEAVVQVTLPGSFSDFSSGWVDGRPRVYDYARVRVERMLKGEPETLSFVVEAWPMWTCDSTRCSAGDRSLFMVFPTPAMGAAPPVVRAMIESVLGTGTVFRNVGSGDGIIPIHGESPNEFVYCSCAPESMRMEGVRYASRFSQVLEYVEGVARFSLPDLAVRAECLRTVRSGDDVWSKPFDLRILPDGSRRLAVGATFGEVVTIDRMSATDWSSLETRLEDLLQDARIDLSAKADQVPLRQLTVGTRRGSLVFAQGGKFDPAQFEDGARGDLVRALELWASVRASVPCADCTDLREEDRASIAPR